MGEASIKAGGALSQAWRVALRVKNWMSGWRHGSSNSSLIWLGEPAGPPAGEWSAARFPKGGPWWSEPAAGAGMGLMFAPMRSGRMWIDPKALGSHIIAWGSTGVGKSLFTQSAIQAYMARMNGKRAHAGEAFERRALAALQEDGWPIGADEALDERHPLVAMMFVRACEDGEKRCRQGEADSQTEALSEQIARRLAGLSSQAPAIEWLDGFLESSEWSLLRQRVEIKLEALALGQAMSPAVATRPRRSAL